MPTIPATETAAPATETTTPEVQAPAMNKKARRKAAQAAAATTVPADPNATPVAPVAPAVPKGPTQRLKIFQFLAMGPKTGRQVADMLGAKSISMILKDEGVCPTPRISRIWVDGNKGTCYQLTPVGTADLAAGLVDEKAAPASPHLGWAGEPSGKPVKPAATTVPTEPTATPLPLELVAAAQSAS
jgi:hypothetical protein